MRVILVDDEKPALDELTYIIEKFHDIHIIGKYTDPIIALEYIKELRPHVIFLDISMPEMDGFMLAEEILKMNQDMYIVFSTAFDEYAIQAFDINAIDYILKPYSEERIEKTIKRIRRQMDKKELKKQESIKKIIQDKQFIKCKKKLAVWKKDRITLLEPGDILYCTVRDGETYIVTKDEDFFLPDSLSKLEETLQDLTFYRCHRSFLINIDQIEEIIPWFNNTYHVKMRSKDEKIPISRRHIKDFRDMFHF